MRFKSTALAISFSLLATMGMASAEPLKLSDVEGQVIRNKKDKIIFKTDKGFGEHKRKYLGLSKKALETLSPFEGKKCSVKKVVLLEKEKWSMITYAHGVKEIVE